VGRLDPGLALLDRTVRALAGTGIEVVVAVAADQRPVLLPDPPPGVAIVESAPLQLLLPHCDAVVGHGGVGTMLTGLVAGLPQLVVAPILPDHRFNGRQLAGSAAGLVLTREEATPEAIGQGVQEVLEEPGYQAAAQLIATEIAAAPSPAEVVAGLEKHAASGT